MKQLMFFSIFVFSMLFNTSDLVAQNANLSEEEKPAMVVVSASYGILLGYVFQVEWRGARRTGRKEVYQKIQSGIIDLGNPSDAMNYMNDLGYELQDVYAFPEGDGKTNVNFVFKKA